MKKVSVLFCSILLAAAAVAQTNISLPTGTAFKVKLENTLATFSSKEGDPFSGRVTEAVMLDGKTVIPVGATVQGRVTRSTNRAVSRASRPSAFFPRLSSCPMANATRSTRSW